MAFLTDTWRAEQYLGLLILLVPLAGVVARRAGLLAGLAFFYVLASSVTIFQNPVSLYEYAQDKMDVVSARAFAATILVTLFVITAGPRARRRAWQALEMLVLFNAALVVWYGNGLFHANSVDAAFTVMAIPVLWFRRGSILRRRVRLGYIRFFGLLLLPLAAVLRGGGSTAPFAAVAAIVGALIAHRKISIKKLVMTAIVILTIGLLIGWLLNGDELLDSNGRSYSWRLFMAWWLTNANWWVGTGSGTFEWLGYGIKSANEGKAAVEAIFIWFHNDYLQVLFEQGIIGLTLIGGLWAQTLWKARARPWLFSSLSACSVIMLTHFPLRFFITQLFITLLVDEALCAPVRKP